MYGKINIYFVGPVGLLALLSGQLVKKIDIAMYKYCYYI